MAEWSKALHLSCNLFGVVGSNPTPDKFWSYGVVGYHFWF